LAAANELSKLIQKEIFTFLSKLRIYNCIIVSQERYVINKVYSRPMNVNDVENGMELVVHTWFPYQSSDRCTEVNDITLLDGWVISAHGHFTKNTDLFPEKISKSLNRCPMKALVRDGHWDFTTKYIKYKDPDGNVLTYAGGLEYDLLKIVYVHMNMSFEHVPSPEGFEM
jgi:hypothetical protein